MSKKEAPQADPGPELTLEEFCTRLSKTDRRVELIGGFHADAKVRRQLKDVDTGFLRAFENYCSRPVN